MTNSVVNKGEKSCPLDTVVGGAFVRTGYAVVVDILQAVVCLSLVTDVSACHQ